MQLYRVRQEASFTWVYLLEATLSHADDPCYRSSLLFSGLAIREVFMRTQANFDRNRGETLKANLPSTIGSSLSTPTTTATTFLEARVQS